MSFCTTPPSQEGGVDGFGLFACIQPHFICTCLCEVVVVVDIYLYYVLVATCMHDTCPLFVHARCYFLQGFYIVLRTETVASR